MTTVYVPKNSLPELVFLRMTKIANPVAIEVFGTTAVISFVWGLKLDSNEGLIIRKNGRLGECFDFLVQGFKHLLWGSVKVGFY